MTWHPDVPNLPIKKPREIEELEQMDQAFLESLPGIEVQEKVEEIAHAVARDYKKQQKNGSASECEEIVSIALNVTGAAIGGQVGLAMIAASNSAASAASQEAFPNNTQEF
jgi:hypothetical protein